jgi:outer membrane immunogenic protein
MRKLLLSATALAAFTAPVFAADLPARRTEPAAPVVYAPLFTWTGAYIGVNAGVGFSNNSSTTFTPLNFTGDTVIFSGSNKTGFVGGGQIGYNWQVNQFVFGAEADIQYADLGNKNTYADFGLSSKNGNYFGTVRGRIGSAFDRALIYATGGLAYGDVGTRLFGGSSTRAGWTVGGGLEYAFTNNWTAKVEGLYVNIDRGNRYGTVETDGGLVYGVSQSKNNDFGVVRVGLNYKF